MRGLSVTKLLFAIVLALLLSLPARGEDNTSTILVISSYNPSSTSMYDNIADFISNYQDIGGKSSVAIVNMNCLSYNEMPLWNSRMRMILSKNNGRNTPSLIVLLGQEAFVSYISQPARIRGDVPIICGLVSKNFSYLPFDEDCIASKGGFDESNSYLYSDAKELINIKGGIFYDYDVKSNIKYIQKLYPNTKNIALITDNTYGGVCMLNLFKKEMKESFSDLNLISLDGRTLNIITLSDKMESLPPNTAVILGTWKIDKDERFYMKESLYMLRSPSGSPIFSISSIVENWSIGGYIPDYYVNKTQGLILARMALLVESGKYNSVDADIIKSHPIFDYNSLKKAGLSKKDLPSGYVLVNTPEPFFKRYIIPILILFTVILILILITTISINIARRTRKLNQKLKKSEADLIIAKSAAEESNNLKTAFLANMSHEIRTPLNAIVGFSDILADVDDPKEKEECVKVIKSNNNLLLQLVGDILDLSKIEANRLEFVYTDFELNDIIHECIGSISQRVLSVGDNNKIKLISDCQLSSCIIHSEKNRLLQVLNNFVTNALKFTSSGTITVGYRIQNSTEGDELYVFCKDTGCGIAKDKLDVIFNRFVKLDTSKQGTGLGLAICQTIIAKVGGKIGVSSELNKGSTFWFSLPYNKDVKIGEDQGFNLDKESNHHVAPIETDQNRKEPIILVAEDNNDNFLLVAALLRDRYILVHAKNGVEAINQVKMNMNKFAAVLMDIKMPEMDGYQATSKINITDESLPVIAVTAYATEIEREKILASGFVGFVTKPVSARELINTIEKLRRY